MACCKVHAKNELNKRTSLAELEREEERIIQTYVKSIEAAIKYLCLKAKYNHILKGYYYNPGWDSSPEIDMKENSLFEGVISTVEDRKTTKELNVEKFSKSLENKIKELGFERFKVQLIPCPVQEKVENGKGFFGDIKYKTVTRKDYKVYLELEW